MKCDLPILPILTRLIYVDLHTRVTNWLDEIKERTRYTKTTPVQGTVMFPK